MLGGSAFLAKQPATEFMVKYNICKKMEYSSKGETKTYWEKVGTMTEFPREGGGFSRIIEIPAIGLKANVFEEIKKSGVKRSAPEVKEVGSEDEIRPEDLPF